MISIILLEPEHASNVGAVARVMANFGFTTLFLINPRCNHLDIEAIFRAKREALTILKKAKIISFDQIKQFDYVIGTSAVLGTDYNIPRVPVFPEQLPEYLIGRKKVALLFGREGIGMRTEEIQACDILMHIPTKKLYKAMNLSHAVAIVLYELAKQQEKKEIAKAYPLITRKERAILLTLITDSLKNSSISIRRQQTQLKVWKSVINKATITKREFSALCGYFRKR